MTQINGTAIHCEEVIKRRMACEWCRGRRLFNEWQRGATVLNEQRNVLCSINTLINRIFVVGRQAGIAGKWPITLKLPLKELIRI